MKFIKLTPSALLQHTGLGEVFYDALMPCLSYLPTLTPEEESIQLLATVYPTLLALIQTRFPKAISPPKMRSFDNILRLGIIKGYALAGEYVKIGEFLVCRMADVVDAMGINSVKHLKVRRHFVAYVERSFTCDPPGSYPSSCRHFFGTFLNILPASTPGCSSCDECNYSQ